MNQVEGVSDVGRNELLQPVTPLKVNELPLNKAERLGKKAYVPSLDLTPT
jgi:hypothetical protein